MQRCEFFFVMVQYWEGVVIGEGSSQYTGYAHDLSHRPRRTNAHTTIPHLLLTLAFVEVPGNEKYQCEWENDIPEAIHWATYIPSVENRVVQARPKN